MMKLLMVLGCLVILISSTGCATASAFLGGMGDGMLSHPPQRDLRCVSNNYGQTIYTRCQ